MPFPGSASQTLRFYKLVHPIKDVAAMRSVLLESLWLDQLCPDENNQPSATGPAKESEVWRWAPLYPLTELLEAEEGYRFYVLSYHQWNKVIPPGIVSGLIHQEVDRWKKEHPEYEDVPFEVMDALREAVRESVKAKALMKASGCAICIDLEQQEVMVFESSEVKAKAIMRRLAPALAKGSGVAVDEVKWLVETLETYLRESRPHAALPADMPGRYARWLAQHARRSEFLVSDRHVVRVALDDDIRLQSEAGNVTLQHGAVALERDLVEEGGARVMRLDLFLTDEAALRVPFKSTSIRVTNEGMSGRIKTESGFQPESDDIEDVMSAVLDCAGHLQWAREVLRMTWAAFDNEVLVDGYMLDHPSLFPGLAITRPPTWRNAPPPAEGAAPLLDHIAKAQTQQLGVQGVTVTVSADDARKVLDQVLDQKRGNWPELAEAIEAELAEGKELLNARVAVEQVPPPKVTRKKGGAS